MPRAGVQELVYVLVHAVGQGTGTVEVHGTRTEAEFAAEALARAEGYPIGDYRFVGATGELVMARGGRLIHTGMFVLPRQIIRKPRVLKGKSDAQA